MVDQLLAFDPGGRGIARFFVRGGAARAARALRRAKRVLLTTGFSLGPGLPETDGPPGTASLGRALRALGAEVTYITDAASLPPLQAALSVLGEPTWILTFHAGGDAALTARRLLAEHAPTHLVAIERPGRTRGGDYRSMRGESVGGWNGPLDALFLEAPRRVVTVGVGDGGNEIGMGKIPWSVIRRNIPNGGLVACRTPTDHLIVCGVSNWGAYGLAAGVRILKGASLDEDLFDPEREKEILEVIVEKGPLVDGVSGLPTATVDGLPDDDYFRVMKLLRSIEKR